MAIIGGIPYFQTNPCADNCQVVGCKPSSLSSRASSEASKPIPNKYPSAKHRCASTLATASGLKPQRNLTGSWSQRSNPKLCWCHAHTLLMWVFHFLTSYVPQRCKVLNKIMTSCSIRTRYAKSSAGWVGGPWGPCAPLENIHCNKDWPVMISHQLMFRTWGTNAPTNLLKCVSIVCHINQNDLQRNMTSVLWCSTSEDTFWVLRDLKILSSS